MSTTYCSFEMGSPEVISLIALAGAGIALIGWWKSARNSQSQNGTTKLLEERYHLLLNNIAASIALRDSEGRLTYCNSYTEVLTGYSLDEILSPYPDGEDFFIRIAVENEKDRIRRSLKVSDVGEPFEFQFQYVDKSGFPRWGETRIAPVLSNGRIVGSLAVTTDATRMVRHQRKVEERNRDLQEFASMLSHDLKAPIVTIKGMTALLDEEGSRTGLPAETRDVLTHIRRAAFRLDKLVSGIIEYSKLTHTELLAERVSLAVVFEEIVKDYAPLISTGDATVEIATGMPEVLGDRTRLYQIFSNLLGNALKYHQPGIPPRIKCQWSQIPHSRLVAITVEDNGRGIPPDKIDFVFRPFQRAHTEAAPEVEGSGIGLASVKKLVERLGGTVTCKSEVGAGTTFTVTLKTTTLGDPTPQTKVD